MEEMSSDNDDQITNSINETTEEEDEDSDEEDEGELIFRKMYGFKEIQKRVFG